MAKRAPGGRIVRMRISPKDCMRIVDALAKIGVDPKAYYGSMSFNLASKMVFESCLIALERDGIIPTRDGFEFLRMMEPFPVEEEAKNNRAAQVAFTQKEFGPSHQVQPITQESPERRRIRVRYEELLFKATHDSDNMDDEEQAELATLAGKMQLPEGKDG